MVVSRGEVAVSGGGFEEVLLEVGDHTFRCIERRLALIGGSFLDMGFSCG